MPNEPINWKTPYMAGLLEEASKLKSYSDMADFIGKKLERKITRNQVIGAMTRNNVAKSNSQGVKYRQQHTWTPERVTLLRSLYAAGFHDGKIAERINKETGANFNDRSVNAKRVKIGAAPAQKKVIHSRQKVPVKKPAVPKIPYNPNRTHTYAVCKWIDGDPKGVFSVCAQPAAINREGNARPYCPHHCSIAYIQPNDRRRPQPTSYL